MKIHNIFYLNLLQKASTNLLTGQINKQILPIIINNKKEWKVEDILMLGIIKVKTNIRLNGLAKIKIENGIILLDLIFFGHYWGFL